MSHIAWNAIRAVAEDINLGDRSYWNLLKIPHLDFGQAREAIRELERNGMVSVTDYRVEPTEAFGSWFVELRRQEDTRTTGRPVEQPAAASQQAIPPGDTPAPRTLRRISKKPSTTALAVRILEKLAGRQLKYFDVGCPISGEMPMGQLRRALNAYRLADWDRALNVCKQFGAISIDQPGKVKLLGVPARLFSPPPRPTRKSAGRYRSEMELAERRAWVTKKRLEKGEDLEEIEMDEPRDDLKDWVAEQRLRQQARPPAPAE